MKSTVLVPFIGDPYVALAFYHSYLKYWREEISQICIGINTINQEVGDFIQSLWINDPKVKVIQYRHDCVQHGSFLDDLYKCADGDVLITMDSDNYVLQKGIVGQYIDQMNEFDVIGSTGLHVNSASMRQDCINDYGFVRINPFMSFWKKSLIEQEGNPTFLMYVAYYDETNRRLASESVSGVDRIRFDTMGWLTFKIFYGGKHPKLKTIPGNNPPQWIHLGATSAATRLLFYNKKTTTLLDSLQGSLSKNPVKLDWLTTQYSLYLSQQSRCPLTDINEMYYENLLYYTNISSFTEDFVRQNISKQFMGIEMP